MTAIVLSVGGLVICLSAIVALLAVKRARQEAPLPVDPLRLLEVQVARGEITTDEYHSQRSKLGEPSAPGSHRRTDSGVDE